ncbi:hypothetical protein KPH14_002232 [Odynerus spinipes]|uniref:mRNA export factor GLE1 n=1 Tax=Odynerus spinipes TaxID=1348599 RepID=A0AAD9RM78_9HYME|nr:hypothetical protein KPH14_002232 [Odynerus spinipes]
MPHFVSNKEEMEPNMSDLTADFDCLKVSALGKVSRITEGIDRITIGPNSDSSENDLKQFENIENEQNSCNVKSPRKSRDEWSNKIATQSGITFSIRKILLEEELQRREKVRKEVERKWQHMEENGTAIQKHISLSRSSMAQERERKSAQKYADILAEEERIAEQEEIKRKHEQQLHAQRAQEQKEKMKRDMEECRRKMKEKEELIKKIVALRHEFGVKYYDIVMLSRNCKDKNAIASFFLLHSATLKQIHQHVEFLDDKIKRGGDLIPSDLNVAETIVQQIDEISCLLKAGLDRIAAAENEVSPPSADIQNTDAKEQKELPKTEEIPTTSETPPIEQIHNNVVSENIDDNKVQEITPTAETPIIREDSSEDTAPSTAPLKEIEDDLYKYVDKESLQIYIHSQEVLENNAKNYDEFLRSASTKKFRFECQKAINIPVNAISAISEQHLKDKYERLHNLLIGKSSPNVNQHPQGAAFCKDVLAKKIVSQGETLVSSKPKMAFPIAAIVVALWNDHADFGELLLAHFHNTCPFTVPVFMPKREGQTNEEYYKSMGYKYSEDGSVEKQDKFLKRMSGIMRLYISVTVTSQRRGITKKHPYGLQHTWRWLAAVLNSESQPNTSDLRATLILDVLEVAGYMLWNAYPKQFHKMLMLLVNDYYPRMQTTDGIGGGPLVRLEEFLKNTLARGSIPPPDGQLPPNFW